MPFAISANMLDAAQHRVGLLQMYGVKTVEMRRKAMMPGRAS